MIDYDELLRDIAERVGAERSQASMARVRVTSRLDAFIESSASESLSGDLVVARLYAALDGCGLQRTATQRMFHRKFVEASLPHVYGKAVFGKFKDRILGSHGILADKYNQYTLISTPRRWGKTTSVAMFVAAMLFTVPSAWISVFSTGRRASKSLADLAHKFLRKLEGDEGRTRVMVKNTEELFYAGDSPTDVRQLFSYPATVQV